MTRKTLSLTFLLLFGAVLHMAAQNVQEPIRSGQACVDITNCILFAGSGGENADIWYNQANAFLDYDNTVTGQEYDCNGATSTWGGTNFTATCAGVDPYTSKPYVMTEYVTYSHVKERVGWRYIVSGGTFTFTE